MRAAALDDLPLSRLMLGTVQFGMDYGIANRTGQPSYDTARDIIACAYDGGITCLDTARAYGSSEDVLGRALAELGIADRVTVATKIQHLTQVASEREAAQTIEASVASSLRALRLETLPICVFHREEDFRYAEHLLKLRDRGLVRHIGSSVMTPDGAAAVIGSGVAAAAQIPTNLLDQRFVRKRILAQAHDEGVAVFVRSVYLQGLLLMPDGDIPPQLRDVIPVRRKLAKLADSAAMSVAELAVRYVLGLDGVTSVLVGVETLEQMRENVKLFGKGPLEPALMDAIAQTVPDLPDPILMPNKWDAKRPAR